MTTELQMLAFASVLGIVQLLLAASAVTAHVGLKYNMSSRDQNAPPIGPKAARLNRAFKNFLETFPIFVAAVALVQAVNHHSQISELGAQLYFYARVLYIPCYLFGVAGVRTLVWAVSLIGIGMVLFAVF